MSGTQRKKNCLVMNLNYGPIFSNFCTPGVGLMLVYNFYVLMSKIQPKKKSHSQKTTLEGLNGVKRESYAKMGMKSLILSTTEQKLISLERKS